MNNSSGPHRKSKNPKNFVQKLPAEKAVLDVKTDNIKKIDKYFVENKDKLEELKYSKIIFKLEIKQMRQTDIREMIHDRMYEEINPEVREKYGNFLKNLQFANDKDYQDFLELANFVDLDNYSVSF
jgi:hypothetical protein